MDRPGDADRPVKRGKGRGALEGLGAGALVVLNEDYQGLPDSAIYVDNIGPGKNEDEE